MTQLKNVLVTGCAGQDGYYLYHALCRRHPGANLFGLYRGQDEERLARLRDEFPRMTFLRGDLTDERSLADALAKSKADAVFNLAAVTSVPLSLGSPRLTYEINTQGVLNLLNAVKDVAPGARVFHASTSEMFGNSPDIAKPLSEEARMLPTSPYGISKVAAHLICREFRKSHKIHVSCGISFNHESTRRPPNFVTRKVTRAAARIARGLDKTVSLGNLDACRDWGFAGDYVEAFVTMVEQDAPDDYVIGTGRAHSIRELIAEAFTAAGIPDWQSHVNVSDAFKRPEDNNYLCADPRKAREKLGWTASTTFSEMIRVMVQHDLA